MAENGRYVAGRYINSFIGFAPKDNPKLLIYVVVNQPHIDTPSAGGKIIAAPIFKSVMERSLHYLKMTPDKVDSKTVEVASDESTSMPDLVGENGAGRQAMLSQAGLKVQVLGQGKTVVDQYPEASTEMTRGSTVYMLTSREGIKMPDLTGKTLREVMELTSLVGISAPTVTGEGYVQKQSIEPGTVVKKGDKLAVTLTPKSAAPPEATKKRIRRKINKRRTAAANATKPVLSFSFIE